MPRHKKFDGPDSKNPRHSSKLGEPKGKRPHQASSDSTIFLQPVEPNNGDKNGKNGDTSGPAPPSNVKLGSSSHGKDDPLKNIISGDDVRNATGAMAGGAVLIKRLVDYTTLSIEQLKGEIAPTNEASKSFRLNFLIGFKYYAEENDYSQAIEYLDKAISKWESIIAEKPITDEKLKEDAAKAYAHRGKAKSFIPGETNSREEKKLLLLGAKADYDKAWEMLGIVISNECVLGKDRYFNLAVDLHHIGENENALECLKIETQINKDNINVGRLMGVINAEMGNHAEAEGHFDNAERNSTIESAESYFGAGCNLLQRKDYENALLSFKKALLINPDHANANFFAGYLTYELEINPKKKYDSNNVPFDLAESAKNAVSYFEKALEKKGEIGATNIKAANDTLNFCKGILAEYEKGKQRQKR